MRFLVACALMVLASSLLSVEGKALVINPIQDQLCVLPVECFVDPCMTASCDGLCTSGCYCNAICS